MNTETTARAWRVSFTHVCGPLHETRLRALVSRHGGQLRVRGRDCVATFTTRADADDAAREADANGWSGRPREYVPRR